MALAIRLARSGAKRRPYYRIVVADTRFPRDGRYIERLGTYNPLLPKDHEQRITILEDRIKHWLERGARPSDRVSRFLEMRGILPAKTRSNPKKAEPGEKTKQRAAERKEREASLEKAAAEAKAAAESGETAETGGETASQDG